MVLTVRKSLLLASALAAAGFGLMTFNAQAADSLTEAQKAEVTQLMKDYIRNNAQEIMDSVQAYQQQQAEQANAMADEKIGGFIKELTADNLPSVGPLDADVTIIEFFDYNCGYCKKVVPDIRKTVESDKKVRIVFKEMPILGPTSTAAAEWALAAHKQGKYFEYHVALMEHNGPKTDESLAELAQKIGLDVEKMKADAKSEDVKKQIQDSARIASEIGIRGTPAFIVNGKLFRGYMGDGGMAEAIKAARAG